jgi:tRNA(Ile)-lysidine synthetase-like protein
MRAGEAVYVPEIAATIRITPLECGASAPPWVEGGGKPPHSEGFQLPTAGDPKFVIRNRRDGDRFQPLGMRREKKLKDFLIDRKIPSEFRDRIPLVLWRGKIVLLAGVEVSEAFKITGEGEVYEVAIEEANQEGIQRETDRQTDR